MNIENMRTAGTVEPRDHYDCQYNQAGYDYASTIEAELRELEQRAMIAGFIFKLGRTLQNFEGDSHVGDGLRLVLEDVLDKYRDKNVSLYGLSSAVRTYSKFDIEDLGEVAQGLLNC